tara:strand:+ start:69818 stop:70300 length:483 start_codon:yes stop_codon:yes gene_type:complete
MDKKEKLIDLIEDFDNAMLVTHGNDEGLQARPMAIADATENGEIWFITDRNSGKIAEIESNPEVGVTMQSGNRFVMLSGTARVVDDQAKIESLWKEVWKVWFPKGKSDPAITLIHVVPSAGEYWDNSGLNGLKYLIKAGKAYFEGDKPAKDEKLNASVKL